MTAPTAPQGDWLATFRDMMAKFADLPTRQKEYKIIEYFQKCISEAEAAAHWESPVDLNDPKNMLQFIHDPIEKFNMFIRKWCPDYAHLIDSDMNDGEQMRVMITMLQARQADTSGKE